MPFPPLDAVQARILGALIEKEITTPEYYPLSLNALIAACNQKSSRDSVMQLAEDEVRPALRILEDADLVSLTHDTRVPRYENRARTVFQLRRDETAILCLLLLRGPQTPGELRSRADRLFTFDDIPAVLSAVQRLTARPDPLVALLPRQPGSKEARYAHLLSGIPDVTETSPAPVSGTATLLQRVESLEREMAELRSQVAALVPSDVTNAE